MHIQVNKAQRFAKMRAHTATHLLHYYLDQYIGGTKQAGSLVDDDYLRFDFAAKKPLSPEQINEIVRHINTIITQAYEVSTKEMSLDEATSTGAKAFFEDTYGDIVRVVSIVGADMKSVELCGGTHVHNTKDIGAFSIIAQESVASGVRRIVAVTGPKVAEYAQQLNQDLRTIAHALDSQPKQLNEKISKLLKEFDHLKSDNESLQGHLIQQHLADMKISCETQQGTTWGKLGLCMAINISGTDLEHHNFKAIVHTCKQIYSEHNRLICSNEGNFALYCGDENISAKALAKDHSLKGGGSDQLVQGRDTSILKLL